MCRIVMSITTGRNASMTAVRTSQRLLGTTVMVRTPQPWLTITRRPRWVDGRARGRRSSESTHTKKIGTKITPSSVALSMPPITPVATCPACKKGIGEIVAVGPRTIYLPAGPAARSGDYIACGCKPGANKLIPQGIISIDGNPPSQESTFSRTLVHGSFVTEPQSYSPGGESPATVPEGLNGQRSIDFSQLKIEEHDVKGVTCLKKQLIKRSKRMAKALLINGILLKKITSLNSWHIFPPKE